jgi:NADPH-dependent ferric siderophore reductase
LPIPCYAIDREAGAFLLAGGETAIPAISQLLEALPPDRYIEIAHPDARLPLPHAPHATVAWHHVPPRRLRAMRSSPPSAGRTSSRARGCGRPAKPRRCSTSAATCSSIEGCPGAHASVRGYWMHGRSADAEDDA